jgi:hypothetical protein
MYFKMRNSDIQVTNQMTKIDFFFSHFFISNRNKQKRRDVCRVALYYLRRKY